MAIGRNCCYQNGNFMKEPVSPLGRECIRTHTVMNLGKSPHAYENVRFRDPLASSLCCISLTSAEPKGAYADAFRQTLKKNTSTATRTCRHLARSKAKQQNPSACSGYHNEHRRRSTLQNKKRRRCKHTYIMNVKNHTCFRRQSIHVSQKVRGCNLGVFCPSHNSRPPSIKPESSLYWYFCL